MWCVASTTNSDTDAVLAKRLSFDNHVYTQARFIEITSCAHGQPVQEKMAKAM